MRLFRHVIWLLALAAPFFSQAAEADLAEMERAAAGQYAAKKYAEAVKTCRAALALTVEKDFPTGIPFRIYCRLADAYLELQQYKEALAAYRKAIDVADLGPFDEYALLDAYESVMCLGLSMEKPAVTIEYGNEMLAVAARYPAAEHFYVRMNGNFLMAEAWMQKRAYPEAIIYFQRCVELLQNKKGKTGLTNIPACIGLACARQSIAESKNNSSEGAIRSLRQFLEVLTADPTLADAATFPELNREFAAALALVEDNRSGPAALTGRFYQSLAAYYALRGNYQRFVHYHKKAIRDFYKAKNIPAAANSQAMIAAWWMDKNPQRAVIDIEKALRMLKPFSGRNADAAQVYYTGGRIFECGSAVVRARELYQLAAASLTPELSAELTAAIYFEAGQGLLAEKKYDPAIRYLKHAAEYARKGSDGKSGLLTLQSLSLLAKALREDGNPEEAIAAVRESIEFRSERFGKRDNADLLRLLGDLYAEKGDMAAAAAAYVKLSEALETPLSADINPVPQIESLILAGDAQARLGENAAAADSADRALDRLEKSPSKFVGGEKALALYRNLLGIYMRNGNRDKAEVCFSYALKRLGKDKELFSCRFAILRGEYYAYSGKPGKSMVYCAIAARELEKIDPAGASILWYDLGKRWYQRKNFSAAADVLEAALRLLKQKEVKPGAVAPEAMAEMYCLRGDALRRGKSFREAEKLLRSGVELAVGAYGPDSARVAVVYTQLGDACFNLRDYPGAEKAFSAAMKCKKHSNETLLQCYWGIARTYFMFGNRDKAISYGRKAEKMVMKMSGKEKLLEEITQNLRSWKKL